MFSHWELYTRFRRGSTDSYSIGWLCRSYSCYDHSYSYQVLDQSMHSLALGRACPLSQAECRLSGKATAKSVGRGSSSTLFLRNNFYSFYSVFEEQFSFLPTGTGFWHRASLLLDFIFQAVVPNHLGWYLKYLISCTCNGAGHLLLYFPNPSPDASEPFSADPEHQLKSRSRHWSAAECKDQECLTGNGKAVAMSLRLGLYLNLNLFSVLTSS